MEIVMTTNSSEPICGECMHPCHCDNVVCYTPVGVGMSDKSVPCGCGNCVCLKDNGTD
jgi:hypothetical protein